MATGDAEHQIFTGGGGGGRGEGLNHLRLLFCKSVYKFLSKIFFICSTGKGFQS